MSHLIFFIIDLGSFQLDFVNLKDLSVYNVVVIEVNRTLLNLKLKAYAIK